MNFNRLVKKIFEDCGKKYSRVRKSTSGLMGSKTKIEAPKKGKGSKYQRRPKHRGDSEDY